jgi:large subunit ribosomal protein L13
MKTIYLKKENVERKWFVINAEDKVLGKVAVKAAQLLRGKHKPEFTPNIEMGDYVVVVNADKAVLTGSKPWKKTYYRHSGYPSGIQEETYDKMVQRKPTYPMERAIRLMLPKNRLGRKLFKNVKVYSGDTHPHAAQMPEIVEL